MFYSMTFSVMKFRIYICPESTAWSVPIKSILQLVKYCVAHYCINWVSNGDIHSDSILCILITWNWSILVNSIKISFFLKNSIQTLWYAVNFFFNQSKKLKAKVDACQLRKLMLNRMTVVSRPDWSC